MQTINIEFAKGRSRRGIGAFLALYVPTLVLAYALGAGSMYFAIDHIALVYVNWQSLLLAKVLVLDALYLAIGWLAACAQIRAVWLMGVALIHGAGYWALGLLINACSAGPIEWRPLGLYGVLLLCFGVTFAAVVTAVGGYMLARARLTGIRFRPDMCRFCGYNLTGNASGRCPECGNEVPSEVEKGRERARVQVIDRALPRE